MERASFKVSQQFCGECSLALRRFIGGMDGVQSVSAGDGTVDVVFDELRADGELVRRITRESIERLGYRIEEE